MCWLRNENFESWNVAVLIFKGNSKHVLPAISEPTVSGDNMEVYPWICVWPIVQNLGQQKRPEWGTIQERKKKRWSAKLKNTGFMLGICREYGNVSLATILQRDNSVTSTFILIVDRSVKCGHFMGTELSYAFVNATIRTLLLFFSILKFFWRAFLLGPFELKGLSAVFTKFLFCNASARLINVSSGKCFKMTTLTCRSNLTCVSTKMNMTMLGLKPD